MSKIVTLEQMHAIEQAADASGLSYDQMMLNAGQTIAEAVMVRLEDMTHKRVVILAGSGNNGGDGLVVAKHLHDSGAQVSVYMAKAREQDANLKAIQEREVLIAVAADDDRWRVLTDLLKAGDVVVDAVLGTGVKLPLRGSARDLLARAKGILERREDPPYVVAVDCPSGLDCDTGEIAEEALAADLTVTLAAAKPGLVHFPGAGHVGELVVGDIGIAEDLAELSAIEVELAEEGQVRAMLPGRPADAHKGTFGTVLVIGGCVNYPGAVGLAALGAYRIGAGLVELATPAPVQSLVAPLVPEATWVLLPHDMGVIAESAVNVLSEALERADSVLLGPGFGQEETSLDFLRTLFLGSKEDQGRGIGFLHPSRDEGHRPEAAMSPAVIDADGLKLLSRIPEWHTLLPPSTVLTPHPGEMSLITGEDKDEIQADRIAAARRWAETWGHVVVLKGAYTAVASPEGKVTVIPVASPALARAGTGDVLAGIIAGLRAQGMSGYEASVLGCYVHAQAGVAAAESLGTTASVLAGEVAASVADILGAWRF